MQAKVSRIKTRIYEQCYRVDEATGEKLEYRRVVQHAEYAVIAGERIYARLKRNNGHWVVVTRADDKKFGLPISPVNVRSFQEAKNWALRKWGGGVQTKCHKSKTKANRTEVEK